jgi:3-oxoacyl-[acyl-carrier protein] reductase
MSGRRRNALVTGGSRGIGLGIARQLAREGCDLLINGRRDLEPEDAALSELRDLGAEVHYVAADIASTDDRSRLVSEARELFGSLDILVNNAGIASLDRDLDLLDAREENFEQLMRVNLQGPFFLTQQIARWMLEDGSGKQRSIIFITSVSAEMISTQRADYCLSKAAGSMAAKIFAARLAADGIGVYEVRPGIIRTDMTAGVVEKYDRFIAEGNLLESRWGTPDDIGRAVAMLARGDLPYAPGLALTIDGGLTQRRL